MYAYLLDIVTQLKCLQSEVYNLVLEAGSKVYHRQVLTFLLI